MDDEESSGPGAETLVLGDDDKRRRVGGGAKRGGGEASPPSCQAERCAADLTEAKRYHRRHKVCEIHAKAPVVLVAGLRQRFCQQCSRFHELSEFDEAKRSCRRRLAGHNERRRKISSELPASSSRKLGPPLTSSSSSSPSQHLQTGNSAAFKHFEIR